MSVKALKSKLLRANVMNAYIDFVRSENFIEAWLLFRLLRNGKIRLGLDDTSYAVERILEKIGCRIRYSRNYDIATAYLTPE